MPLIPAARGGVDIRGASAGVMEHLLEELILKKVKIEQKGNNDKPAD